MAALDRMTTADHTRLVPMVQALETGLLHILAARSWPKTSRAATKMWNALAALSPLRDRLDDLLVSRFPGRALYSAPERFERQVEAVLGDRQQTMTLAEFARWLAVDLFDRVILAIDRGQVGSGITSSLRKLATHLENLEQAVAEELEEEEERRRLTVRRRGQIG